MSQSQYLSQAQAQAQARGGSTAGYFNYVNAPTQHETYSPAASSFVFDKSKKFKKLGNARR